MRALLAIAATALLTVVSARGAEPPATFGDDLTFLRRHVEVIELRDAAAAPASPSCPRIKPA